MNFTRRSFLKGTATSPLVGLFLWLSGRAPAAELPVEVAEEVAPVAEPPAAERFFLRAHMLDFPKVKCGDTYTSQFEIARAEFYGKEGDGTAVMIGSRTIQFQVIETDLLSDHRCSRETFGGVLRLSLKIPKGKA